MPDSNPEQERVVSVFIDAPIERVWAEITKTGSVQRALTTLS
jgi:hypothetical protein